MVFSLHGEVVKQVFSSYATKDLRLAVVKGADERLPAQARGLALGWIWGWCWCWGSEDRQRERHFANPDQNPRSPSPG